VGGGGGAPVTEHDAFGRVGCCGCDAGSQAGRCVIALRNHGLGTSRTLFQQLVEGHVTLRADDFLQAFTVPQCARIHQFFIKDKNLFFTDSSMPKRRLGVNVIVNTAYCAGYHWAVRSCAARYCPIPEINRLACRGVRKSDLWVTKGTLTHSRLNSTKQPFSDRE
jgi:hypothetical protein